MELIALIMTNIIAKSVFHRKNTKKNVLLMRCLR